MRCGQSVATHGGGGGGRRSERVVQKSCISAVDESVAGGMRRLTHFVVAAFDTVRRISDDREEEEEEEKRSVRVGDGDSSVPIFHSRDGLMTLLHALKTELQLHERGPAIPIYLHYLSFLAIPTLRSILPIVS